MSDERRFDPIRHVAPRGDWAARLAIALAMAWTAATTLAAQPATSPPPAPEKRITKISEHLLVYRGPINIGIVRDGNKALLVDCGDRSVVEALAELGVQRVEQIAFTHHHRDQACGAYGLAREGAKIGVPAAERELFTDPQNYWEDENIWRVYRDFRRQRLMLIEPFRVDAAFSDGDQFTFGPATIRVFQTPGHTEGSVSYLVQVDGNQVVFCGDLIYDKGQIWDLYSLQRGFRKGSRQIGGYHGFMGDRWRLADSLQRVKRLGPDLLVPSHGKLLDDPAGAVDLLVDRLEKCYEKYVAISALRHYFPELFTDYAGRPGQMPVRPGIPPPACLRHSGTTWMLVSKTGAALVMDVGSPRIVPWIQKMLDDGQIKRVEGLWVTHYHYDHTAGIPEFQQAFDCPCFADRRLAAVLTEPTAWRLPCLAAEPIRVDRPTEDGQSWQWHEFKLTAYNYPGQTLYHDALLAEAEGLRMLFAGDSHTMAGVDDYCAFNRNWLGRGVGYQYCLSLIEKLKPTHIFNCHVKDAFAFTAQEIQFMRRNLDEREEAFGQLVPWDHANYAMDASWARCYPYAQQRAPGERVKLSVVITNHSAKARTARCRAVLPKAFGGRAGAWAEVQVPPKTEKAIPLEVIVPADVRPGRYVVAIDMAYDSWQLPQFADAVVDVADATANGSAAAPRTD